MNTPYRSNDSKELFKTKEGPEDPNAAFGDKDITNLAPPKIGYQKTDAPLLDLKLYQEGKTKSTAATKQASIPIEPIALTTPFFPPQFQTQLSNFMKNFYTPFIYKDYHINIGGPDGDHIQASMIYEDAMPPLNIFTSYKSLKERNNLNQHIRSTFINIEEGEAINFGGKENSLLSRLKLIELNPYNTNRYSNNPYDSLPKDMFIFNSCYPVQFDKSGATIQCKKNSTGINLRLYRLKIEEAVLINQVVKKPLIFENIIYDFKKKEIARKLVDILENESLTNDEKKKKTKELIDKKIDEIDGDNKNKILNIFEYGDKLLEDQKKEIYSLFDETINKTLQKEVSNKNFNVWREIEYYKFIREEICKNLISPNFVQSYCYFVDNNSKINFIRNGKIDSIRDLTELYSKKVLVVLTESPNYNFFDWCSDVYEKDYNVRKQVYRGFKDDYEWKSIIAQMLIAFYIMFKKNFTITDMEIKYNFYIKEVNFIRESTQYWKYTINGIDYYIGNYGSLLLVDSNYRDLEIKDPKNPQFKIISDNFNDDEDKIKEMVINNALRCLNFDNFTQDFKNAGGVVPSENVKKYLDEINKELVILQQTPKDKQQEKFRDILKYLLRNYVHNRIGTPLRDPEIRFIAKGDVRPFRKGELVLHESKWQTYEIVLFMNFIENDDSRCKVLTRNSQNKDLIEEKDIPIDILYHYTNNEIIKQDVKIGEPALNLDYIIENYVIE
jgi:hypothetical protein